MPTKKPRVTFALSEEELERVESFRKAHNIKNQSQAILALIERGIESTNSKKEKCSVSDLLGDGPAEKIQLPAKDQELLDAYHDADYDTRTIVDLALKPYKRAAAETAV